MSEDITKDPRYKELVRRFNRSMSYLIAARNLLKKAKRWLHQPGIAVDAAARAATYVNHERFCDNCRDFNSIDRFLEQSEKTVNPKKSR